MPTALLLWVCDALVRVKGTLRASATARATSLQTTTTASDDLASSPLQSSIDNERISFPLFYDT